MTTKWDAVNGFLSDHFYLNVIIYFTFRNILYVCVLCQAQWIIYHKSMNCELKLLISLVSLPFKIRILKTVVSKKENEVKITSVWVTSLSIVSCWVPVGDVTSAENTNKNAKCKIWYPTYEWLNMGPEHYLNMMFYSFSLWSMLIITSLSTKHEYQSE